MICAQQRLDLSGEWKVSLDNSESQTIILPNTLDGAGIGEPNTLSPALTKPQLSRLTRKHSFIGEAKYQRDITITKEMAHKPLELLLERVMWRSRLLIDGQDAGQVQESLVSPHIFNVKGLEGKFLPVFWSPVHFPKQAGTMGLLCDPRHPALAHFPTDMHSDWQWWNLVKRSRVMVMDDVNVNVNDNVNENDNENGKWSPFIVESIDNFVNNRRLAQIFEAKVGKGSLIFSSIDLLTDSHLPELRQMQYSLLKYMQSSDFRPVKTITESDLRSLLLSESTEQKTSATSIYD